LSGRASRHRIALVVMTIGVLLCMAPSASANGIDLLTREARQGNEISVTGHAWLTCCPTNTPIEHVRLFLFRGPSYDASVRVLLFDVAANEEGVISTEFTVPYVAPGRYRLETCSGATGEVICIPEGRFTVLLGPPSSASTPSPLPDVERSPDWVLPMFALLAIAAAAVIPRFLRRRRATSS